MMWAECKEIWTEGPLEYICQMWNLLDFGMLSIFIAAFTARFLAFLEASKAQQFVDGRVKDNNLSLVPLPPEVEYYTYGKITDYIKNYIKLFGLRRYTKVWKT